jgi:hypothetical protein
MSCQVCSGSSSARPKLKPAQLGHPVVQRGLQRTVVPDVGLGGHDPPVQRLDLLDRLIQILRRRHRIRHRSHLASQIDRDDVRALLRQPHRVAAALPARRPGDERDLPCYPSSHLCLLVS